MRSARPYATSFVNAAINAVPVRVFIQEDAPGKLWLRVEECLATGREVWLYSPLLKRIADVFGQNHDGRLWLILRPRRDLRTSHFLTRARDILLSSILLLFLSPLLLVMAIAVCFSSKGPILYSATVVGLHRRPFTWFKFRSMRVSEDDGREIQERRQHFETYAGGCDSAGELPGKIVNIKRITPVGAFIRRFSIDELPQLLNVLMGQMSLVGPRPCLAYEADFYSGWRDRRFKVVPGLTGLWQVFGRGVATFDEGAAMDVFYVYRRSFMFDLHLMFLTILVVWKGRGGL